VIYWKFLDIEPPFGRQIARQFAEVSGYEVSETPVESSYAGYKDWFILEYNRPGFTIEAGVGVNPLPISQFDEIYRDNLGILALGLTATT
jgi:g-D-glutamyl-meso-diaminopimelate peptidase